MSNEFQTGAEINAAERQAAQEAAAKLKGKSKEELLELAKGFQDDYNAVLNVRYNTNKASAWHFFEILGEAFPEASHPQKMQLANKLAELVKAEMGEVKDVPQTELMAVRKKRDMSVEALSKHFTAEECHELDRQARTRIKELPESYLDEDGPSVKDTLNHRRSWLAEWVAKGILDYPVK